MLLALFFIFFILPGLLRFFDVVGFPILVLVAIWVVFLALFAPINYYFGPFITFDP